MRKTTKLKVKDEFYSCVVNTIERLKKSKGNHRPFHSQLLSEEILKASLFERSFSTSFGQRVIEQISKIIAEDTKGTTDVQNQKITIIDIPHDTTLSIHLHLQLLRDNKLGRSADWLEDIKSITVAKNKLEQQRVISDLWFRRGNIDHYFSIKTVKPNIDQTMEAKRDILRLYSVFPECKAYFALPYNPYGEEKKLYAHNPPFKIFNMIKDEVVLIGKDYWDILGGKGTYSNLLQIAEEVGEDTRKLLDNIKVK
ncbi:MAG: restriction endonuclease [Halobacteriovoraceae bacterium]|nr:restriction endonuclease [Halobacteriovoraceae bacterium]|tara:strand:- start:15478 stop:16239 length:762 start_codon:yes stop_codon:yes gene_type:complete